MGDARRPSGPGVHPGAEDATARLDLFVPTPADVPELFAILSDPRVWTHFPSLRHTRQEQTADAVRSWITGWEADGIGTWVVRERGAVVGYGGVDARGSFWNLGYRFAPSVQGRGYATELSLRAKERAASLDPERPLVAYLLEHNTASAAVARKVGLTLAHAGPDAGNPDPGAVRLVFADRPLDAATLAAVLR